MMNDLEKRNFDLEFQQKKFIMLGGELKNVSSKLPPEVIKKMKQEYVKMFYAFTSINWGQGKTLGVSWQKALSQMDAFVTTKMKIANHPINAELIKFHQETRRQIAKSIMTNPYVDEKLNERFQKGFFDYGNKTLSESKHALDDMFKKYMPRQEITKKPQTFEFDLVKNNIQKMMQQLMAGQNQYAA